MNARRFIVWAKDAGSVECADVQFDGARLVATGTTITPSGPPYRLDYVLETHPAYVTARLRVTVTGDGRHHELDLRADGDGNWSSSSSSSSSSGVDVGALRGALHCDLGGSPLTNTLPVLAHGIRSVGATHAVLAAWVSVPDLTVRAHRQRYTFVAGDAQGSTVRYESLDSSFSAEIRLDRDGLVVDYPGLAHVVNG